MATSNPFDPPPNTPIAANPTDDAFWKRWLYQLWNRVKTGALGGDVVGPSSSTDNAVARWNGTSGKLLQNSGVIIDDSNNVTGVVNLTATGNLEIDGNTTLGNASGDTLTINAGTWTYGANWVATRDAGTLPAGVTSALTTVVTGIADSGGTTNIRGTLTQFNTAGTNAYTTISTTRFSLTHATAANITNGFIHNSSIDIQGTGNITNTASYNGGINLTSSGSVSNGTIFNAPAPILSGTGTINTLRGFLANNLGHATLVQNTLGFDAVNMTISGTITASFRSQQNSGTGAWGFLHTGTANNSFNGNTLFGTTTPTAGAEKVQVNGALSINDTTLIRTYTAFTDGAAAAAGTLLNAPAAGNPTKWIPVNDNGTVRYIPAW